MKQFYHNRYGVVNSWPMMPGGHALTVDEFNKLRLKYNKENLSIKK